MLPISTFFLPDYKEYLAFLLAFIFVVPISVFFKIFKISFSIFSPDFKEYFFSPDYKEYLAPQPLTASQSDSPLAQC